MIMISVNMLLMMMTRTVIMIRDNTVNRYGPVCQSLMCA